MFKVADRVKETTTSTGTGAITLAGPQVSFQSFAAGIGNGNRTYYCISHRTLDEWEVGVGEITTGSPNLLTRTSILASSNGGAIVDFSPGTKDIFCTHPAEKTLHLGSNEGPGTLTSADLYILSQVFS